MGYAWTALQSDLTFQGGTTPMDQKGELEKSTRDIDVLGPEFLSIALIGTDQQSHRAIADALNATETTVLQEYFRCPEIDEVPKLIEQNHDIVIIGLDGNPEDALDLVENLCGKSSATVMVYATEANAELMVRSMRAGAREFLTSPYTTGSMIEALVRTSARRLAAQPARKTGGKLLVFFGAKGGSGVTTLATNYAILLARESNQNTLFIDLDLPLGDAALVMGLTLQYSTVDALQNASRLDSNFLSKLTRSYSPKLSVLGAPGKFSRIDAAPEAIDKLMSVARQDFDYVVVDTGSRLDLIGTTLFEQATTLFLVSQPSIPELRNSNRMISQLFTGVSSKLEVVLNRYSPSIMGVDEESISKALTMTARWKIPDDYATVTQTQNSATPLALSDTAISKAIRLMARSACGMSADPEKKKRLLSLFS